MYIQRKSQRLSTSNTKIIIKESYPSYPQFNLEKWIYKSLYSLSYGPLWDLHLLVLPYI